MHICDSGYLCRFFDIYPMNSEAFIAPKNYYTRDTCQLLISGVGVQIAADTCVNLTVFAVNFL